MHVRKTLQRSGSTLAHGCFEVCEAVYVCAAGCTVEVCSPSGAGKQLVPVTRRSSMLAELLPPRRTVGYDVMCFVGLERFLRHRQREEIRAALDQEHGIRLSTGEVSTLASDFVVYLEALHEARASALGAALAQDGGYPLHIDATGEDGRGTLLVALAGWRRWVLGSWKIPTERADAILPRLRGLVDRFGAPCAVMRDLGRAVTEAARDLVKGLDSPPPVLSCHFHFARDVGKDLLTDAHDDLRSLFRRFRIRSGLRALARSLGRQLGAAIDEARDDLAGWLDGEAAQSHVLPGDRVGLAIIRALAQWVLDYPADGEDEGFPFDLPYLDLWRRCQRVLRAAEAYLRTPSPDQRVQRAIEHLHRIVEPVRGQSAFKEPVAILEDRVRLFGELRQALRLRVKPTAASSAGPAEPGALAELNDIEVALGELTQSLRERRPERGPAQSTRHAIDIVLAHLDRHGTSLRGHVVHLPAAAGGGVRLVDRTNLLSEGFFHGMKHGERRRSGRKVLSQDFERLPAGAALARNLALPDYVAILCGSLDGLPRAFAALDSNGRGLALPARQRARADPTADIVSASLPSADRRLLRSEQLDARLQSAARSRAPRLAPARQMCAATDV
jgi:hypothetical protein